ncbi:MAG TPA: M1 family metallopeptidase [Kofleriaceae bacterium]|nr:M1 family metallopeptidase [Kofleriaceae bacterium]
MRAAPLLVLVACGTVASHPTAKPIGESQAPAKRAVVPPPDPTPPALRLPDDVEPLAYRVRWNVDANKTDFSGHVDIDVAIRRATDHVWLNAVGLAITAPTYTHGDQDHALDAIAARTADVVGFRFHDTLGAGGQATLHFDFTGGLTNEFAGFFHEQDTGRWYLYSQFESSFARRAVPSFDEPRWKVPWTVTLVVPVGQQAFSNTPIHEVRPHADGTSELEFEQTPPYPSYLIAIAVGPFESIDAGKVGKNQVPARIIVPAGHAAEATYAAHTTAAVVAALEDYFDMPLPLAKLDEVAVPQFFGAMENPGLVTYQSGILLAPKGGGGDDFKHQFIWISGHELAHQWFGDLVTLAWWDDLWLNESFATWMADKVGASIDPRWDAAIRNADENEKAMQADALPGARPLHREIHATSEIEGAFDAISYEKGGAVLSMFERWVGADAFRSGVRAYLAKHAKGNATADDFVAAIASMSTPEVSESFRGFLDQAGVPLVRASLRCDKGRKPVLALAQERLGDPHAPASWKVPVCARWAGAGKAKGEQCALVGASAELELDTPECPTAIDANAGAAGYYRVAYDGATRAAILAHLDQLEPAERLALAGDTAALVDLGDADLGDALALARALFAHKDAHAQLAALDLIAKSGELVDDAHRPAWKRWVIAQIGARAKKLGFAPMMGAGEVARRARERLFELDGGDAQDPAVVAIARKQADAWLSGKRTIDPDDLDLVLAIAAAGADGAFVDKLLDAAHKSKDSDELGALLGAVGAIRDPALVDRVFDAYVDGGFELRASGLLLQGVFTHAETRDRAWQVLHDRFDAVLARIPRMFGGYLALTAAAFCDDAHRKDAEDFLRPRMTKLPEGPRLLDQSLAQVDRCIALRARNADAVAKLFK